MRDRQTTTHQEPKATPAGRRKIVADILQQVRNEVQQTLLLDAPESWADEQLDQIEKQVLEDTRFSLAAVTTDELQSGSALRIHTTRAVAETLSLIQSVKTSKAKWAFPDDPGLTTLPVMLTLENDDWATIDGAIRRFRPMLKGRHNFVEKAVGYALDSLEE